MARTIRHARLESRTSRSRLKRGRQPHWSALLSGPRPAHLGYQIWKGEAAGRWVLRRYIGSDKYRVMTLGRADDAEPADGLNVLDFDQATATARAMIAVPVNQPLTRMTVRQAMTRYAEYKRGQGADVGDLLSRTRVHILPALGDLVVAELTAEHLRRWLVAMAATPPQSRPKANKPIYRAAPTSDEGVRARRATANRVLTMLKAGLNHAFDEGHVSSRDPWGRKLKPFRDVEVARVRYLKVDEARRLVNAADPEFRSLLRAALETGARYSELTRAEVTDFNPDAGTLAIRKSKSGKPRHIVLTEEGSAFFRQHAAGRAGHALMFQHEDGMGWKKSEQSRPMREACARAKIKPAVNFHALRHTWASLAVMGGVPLLIVAGNLGHASTVMVEKHYGHLASNYVTEAIRAGAPRFGIANKKTVVPLR
jgi:integrase